MNEESWLSSGAPFEMLLCLAGVRGRELQSAAGRLEPPPKEKLQRKLRLLACALCRLVWHALDGVERNCVLTAEQHAEGLVDDASLERARQDGRKAVYGKHGLGVSINLGGAAYQCCAERPCLEGSNLLVNLVYGPSPDSSVTSKVQADYVREVFGNPFRPIAWARGARRKGRSWSLAWLTPEVLSVAEAIYEEKDFASLPVLADALEDAGCQEEDFVEEVRCAGEVRGRGNKGMGYYEYWLCLKCGNKCFIAPQEEDGRCHVRKTVTRRRVHQLLDHLRSPGPHVRGCWALDAILGR